MRWRNFEPVIAKDPNNANAFGGRAIALMELRRFADAVESYDLARALDPSWIETLYGRASALIELERYRGGDPRFPQLLAVRPDYPYALGMMVHAQNMSCDWSDRASASELVQTVREGKKTASPFAMLQVSRFAGGNAAMRADRNARQIRTGARTAVARRNLSPSANSPRLCFSRFAGASGGAVDGRSD